MGKREEASERFSIENRGGGLSEEDSRGGGGGEQRCREDVCKEGDGG